MNRKTKHIFVTGGVVSSLGKGLTSASLGMLIESRGLKVAMQKFDPYINVDPGTMSPFQHGEVYVTDDGAEADLDLGHYERFTNTKLTRHSNYTTGQIYLSVIEKERAGVFLGATVQVVPHITDEIKAAINSVITPDTDVVITEIGGTVGDIEGRHFLEAIRQFGLEKGRENVVYIHLTYLPYLRTTDEVKTKPTQHSVDWLRMIGVTPDALICRTEKPVPQSMKDKISLLTSVPKGAVFDAPDVESIYELPLLLHERGFDDFIVSRLGLDARTPDLTRWKEMVERQRKPDVEIDIAIVGKYMTLEDSYKSIFEAIDHAGTSLGVKVNANKIHSEELEKRSPEELLRNQSAILVPGGFGERGIEGKIVAAGYARRNSVPYFGICLGMQVATIEFARNVLGLAGANSSEIDPKTPHRVISLLDAQAKITDYGGTQRCGAYRCRLAEGSIVHKLYGVLEISERHRHRFEFNSAYKEIFEKAGMKIVGTNPEENLVEIINLEDHPYFVGVQFHPEFQSKPLRPHPLFVGFINAALSKNIKQHQR
ncbi:MAG: CTP synthase [Planctomycetes bacterium]|nr:CTP synthase [Planctomycetota bacterium]